VGAEPIGYQAATRRRVDIALDYADEVMDRRQFRGANIRVLERPASQQMSEPRGKVHRLCSGATSSLALMTPVLRFPGRGTRTVCPETVEIRWKGVELRASSQRSDGWRSSSFSRPYFHVVCDHGIRVGVQLYRVRL
jgi:hypothetical protein